jgi:hypothetical protein
MKTITEIRTAALMANAIASLPEYAEAKWHI